MTFMDLNEKDEMGKMGNEEDDGLLQFIASYGKTNFKTKGGGDSAAAEDKKLGIEGGEVVVAASTFPPPAPPPPPPQQSFSTQAFWNCVWGSLLTVSFICAAMTFCPVVTMKRDFWIQAKVSSSTPRPRPSNVYQVPLHEREGGSSDEIKDGSFPIAFDVNHFGTPTSSSMFSYEGTFMVHEGGAYLTSRPSKYYEYNYGPYPIPADHCSGRLLHNRLVRMKLPEMSAGRGKQHKHVAASFRSSFVFSIESEMGSRFVKGEGFAFVLLPEINAMGGPGENLGVVMNSKSNTFAVEFDVFDNPSLHDMSNNHVGINVNSMKSVVAKNAGFWTPTTGVSGSPDERYFELDLTASKIQAWIEYDSPSQLLTVTLSPHLGCKPAKPLLQKRMDLSKVFTKYMQVGFSASTGEYSAKHVIHSWKFETFKELPQQHLRNVVPNAMTGAGAAADFAQCAALDDKLFAAAKVYPRLRQWHTLAIPRRHRRGDHYLYPRPSIPSDDHKVSKPNPAWVGVEIHYHRDEAVVMKELEQVAFWIQKMQTMDEAELFAELEKEPELALHKKQLEQELALHRRPLSFSFNPKDCGRRFLPDFSAVNLAFTEDVLTNVLWVLSGFLGGLLVLHLIFIAYQILLNCYDTLVYEAPEVEVVDDPQVGYVLVVSGDEQQQQGTHSELPPPAPMALV